MNCKQSTQRCGCSKVEEIENNENSSSGTKPSCDATGVELLSESVDEAKRVALTKLVDMIKFLYTKNVYEMLEVYHIQKSILVFSPEYSEKKREKNSANALKIIANAIILAYNRQKLSFIDCVEAYNSMRVLGITINKEPIATEDCTVKKV